MDEEILKTIEQNKDNGTDVDLMSLISGGESQKTNNTNDNINQTFFVINEDSGLASIAVHNQLLVHTENGKKIIVCKNGNQIGEVEFEDWINSIEVFNENENFLTVVFENGAAKIFELKIDQKKDNFFTLIWHADKDILSIKCNAADFYVLKKIGHIYQIVKLVNEYMVVELREEVIIKTLISKNIPKMVFCNNNFLYTRNNYLISLCGEETRIHGEEFLGNTDNLVVVDTKNKRKIVYLVGKEFDLLNECIFNIDEKYIVKIVDDFAAISFNEKIFLLRIKKGKLKRIGERNIDGKILDFVITKNGCDLEVFIIVNGKKESKFDVDTDMANLICNKILTQIESGRLASENREKKRFEALLEKICEQLNKNLKLIIENAVKQELKPVVDKFEKEFVKVVEKKIQSKFDGGFKNHETALQTTVKSLFLKTLVPAVEAGVNEMRLQVVDEIKKKSISAGSNEEKINTFENKSTKLFSLLKRNEVQKGIELVLDSNEEVYYEFINSFKPDFLKFVDPIVVFELFRKSVLYYGCNESDIIVDFVLKILEFVAKKQSVLDVFVFKITDGLINKIPMSVLLPIYAAVIDEASKNNKPEYISFMELVFTNVDVQVCTVEECTELLKIIDTTNLMLSKSTYNDKVLKRCMEIQKNYLKKIVK